MFENITNFFKKLIKTETKEAPSKNTAKERLHLVLMQDRANVSADFLELMKQEIIEVIKKYIEVEDSAIDVRLTNEVGEDGKQGAPSLYANIPILNIKNNIKSESNPKDTEIKENEEKNKNIDKEKNEEINEDVKQEEQKEVEEEKKITEENTEIEKEEISKIEKVEEEQKDIKNKTKVEKKNSKK